MDVTIWGCRGSLPAPSIDNKYARFSTAEFGGNTTCVSIETGDGLRVVLDAGSGVVQFGKKVLQESQFDFTKSPADIIFLFTHTHWDHIQGYPFFPPAYHPANRIRLYGQQKPHDTSIQCAIEDALSTQQEYPNFPVSMKEMLAQHAFEDLNQGERLYVYDFDNVVRDNPLRKRMRDSHTGTILRRKSGLIIEATVVNHPDGCLAFKVIDPTTARAFVFCTDDEPHAFPNPRIASLCQGKEGEHEVVLLIKDGMLTPDEMQGIKPPCRLGWGHSTPFECVDVALTNGVPHLVITHHDPSHDDAFLRGLEEETQDYARQQPEGATLKVEFAREQMRFEI